MKPLHTELQFRLLFFLVAKDEAVQDLLLLDVAPLSMVLKRLEA